MNATAECNVMFDTETVSTDPTAGILSIAAVPFMWGETLPFFYEKASLKSLEAKGFTISRQTMGWWDLQTAVARQEAFSGTQDILQLMSNLEDYLKELPGKLVVWGNGGDFDVPIITHAFDEFGIETPWTYRSARCYRTLKNLFPQVVANKPVTAHNALDDARSQAEHATRIFSYIEMLRLKE